MTHRAATTRRTAQLALVAALGGPRLGQGAGSVGSADLVLHEQFITVPELAVVGAWLGLPTYLLACAVQLALFHHGGLTVRRHPYRVCGAVAASVVLSYLLTFVVWVAVPVPLLVWPATFGDWPFMFLGLFFAPAVLASTVIFSGVTWGGLSVRRAAQREDAADEGAGT